MGNPANYPLIYHCENSGRRRGSQSPRGPSHDRDGGAAGSEDRPYVRSDLSIKKLVRNVDDG